MAEQPINPDNPIDPTTLTGVSSYRQRQKDVGNERTDVYLSKELKVRVKQLASSQNRSTPDTLQACLELGVFCLEQGLTLVQLAPTAQPQPTPSLDAITGSLTANPYSNSLTSDFASTSASSVFAPQSIPPTPPSPQPPGSSTPTRASTRAISADDALQEFLQKRKNKRP